jgi:hypothetical protein
MEPNDDDVWYAAWSCLCHQYCVSTASYAAVPHLVEMAEAAEGRRRLDFLSLVGSVEAFRHLPGSPTFPPGLKDPYLQSLEAAKVLAIGALHRQWPQDCFRELMGVVTVFCGHPRLGAGILLGEAAFTCGGCGATQPLPGYAEFDG